MGCCSFIFSFQHCHFQDLFCSITTSPRTFGQAGIGHFADSYIRGIARFRSRCRRRRCSSCSEVDHVFVIPIATVGVVIVILLAIVASRGWRKTDGCRDGSVWRLFIIIISLLLAAICGTVFLLAFLIFLVVVVVFVVFR